MKTANIVKDALKIILPLVFGGAILWWMYRDFNWEELWTAVEGGMDWTWMWLSLPFGVLAQLLRALRWRQALAPLGEQPRRRVCVHAIFLSYASSLVVPRIGEVLRCGVLKRYDDVAFAKSVGTVVTERIVDALVMLLFTALIVCSQLGVFMAFLDETGMNFDALLHRFSATGYWVTAVSLALIFLMCGFVLYRLSWFKRTKNVLRNMTEGILSLRGVRNIPLYITYSVGIWLAYFMHFYLTFHCFAYTHTLGISVALIAFVVGSFAVLVPTPNGAGPWHFAVKTILVLYGVGAASAAVYVLVVHTLQTLLVAILGLYSVGVLAFLHPRKQLINQ